MKIGITVGQVGNKFDVIAMPDKTIMDQRKLFKSLILNDGNFEKKRYDKIVYFEKAEKVKRFKPEVKEPVKAKKPAQG
jgi:hypothetical protein